MCASRPWTAGGIAHRFRRRRRRRSVTRVVDSNYAMDQGIAKTVRDGEKCPIRYAGTRSFLFIFCHILPTHIYIHTHTPTRTPVVNRSYCRRVSSYNIRRHRRRHINRPPSNRNEPDRKITWCIYFIGVRKPTTTAMSPPFCKVKTLLLFSIILYRVFFSQLSYADKTTLTASPTLFSIVIFGCLFFSLYLL